MVRIVWSAILSVAVVLIPALAMEAAAPPLAPALWKVSDDDSEIYIFALAPFLPSGEGWRSRAVAAAIDRSETIWFEASSADPASRALAGKIFQQDGTYSDGKTLSSALGDRGATGLSDVASALGVEPDAFEKLRPWAAFVVLSAELDRKRGADPAAGVETGVLAEAIGRQRTVQFLDTVEGALRVLTEMPEAEQQNLLLFLLADWPRQSHEARAVYDLWRRGDADGLAFRMQAPLKDTAPLVYERLVKARAEALAERISGILAMQDEAFICLSASVVVGEDGVVAALASRGFTVARLDAQP